MTTTETVKKTEKLDPNRMVTVINTNRSITYVAPEARTKETGSVRVLQPNIPTKIPLWQYNQWKNNVDGDTGVPIVRLATAADLAKYEKQKREYDNKRRKRTVSDKQIDVSNTDGVNYDYVNSVVKMYEAGQKETANRLIAACPSFATITQMILEFTSSSNMEAVGVAAEALEKFPKKVQQ